MRCTETNAIRITQIHVRGKSMAKFERTIQRRRKFMFSYRSRSLLLFNAEVSYIFEANMFCSVFIFFGEA